MFVGWWRFRCTRKRFILRFKIEKETRECLFFLMYRFSIVPIENNETKEKLNKIDVEVCDALWARYAILRAEVDECH